MASAIPEAFFKNCLLCFLIISCFFFLLLDLVVCLSLHILKSYGQSATCAMLFEGVLYRIAVLVLRLLSDVVLKGRPASGFYFQLGFLV